MAKPGRKLIDLTGQRFGSWLVLWRATDRFRGRPRWFCRCLCGTARTVDGGQLRDGRSRRCVECAQAENSVREKGKVAARHAEILRMREEGLTLQQIGDRYGVSPPRIHQIISAEFSRG